MKDIGGLFRASHGIPERFTRREEEHEEAIRYRLRKRSGRNGQSRRYVVDYELIVGVRVMGSLQRHESRGTTEPAREGRAAFPKT